ncbi:MAG: membrane protein insertase YidC [Verrucomicrobiota bacterium]
MDRQAWIAVTLCVLGLIAWQFYMTSHTPPPPPRALASPTPAPQAPLASAIPSAQQVQLPAEPDKSVDQPTPTPASFTEKTEVLRNADLELLLTNRGAGIREANLPGHVMENGAHVKINANSDVPIGAILEKPTATVLEEFAMARQPDGSVQFERVEPGQVTLRKRFSLPSPPNQKDNYVAQLEVNFKNEGANPYIKGGYFIALGSAAPTHQKDWENYTRVTWCVGGKAKYTDVNWFAEQNKFLGLQKRPAQEFYTEKLNGAEWAGVSNQFFVTLLSPLDAKATEIWARRFAVKPAPTPPAPGIFAIEGAMGMPGFQLQPGQTATAKFQIYAGPKLYHSLAQLEHNEAEIMDFGIFKIVCQVLLNALNSLHSVLKSYGVAILALTTIIKLILWPLQTKANRSMRRMSALSPKMQELRDKYKDDPTRMNQEVMKLYKDYGVNPVSGCLPMLIQIPIFFGLFTMLRQAVELRNASFLWVHDLSQPDTIGHVPGFGWPINILPLIMAGTNIWLMRLTPKSGDATQQKVMMFMPLIFVVFCYNFAAALALYYTTQNLFTILQLYQTRNQPLPVLEKVATAGKKARKGRR